MMSARTATGTLTIADAEGVSFQIPLAGPLTRFLAWSIDLAALVVIITALSAIFTLVRIVSIDFATGAQIFAVFLIILSYGIALEWFWRGQTLGKRIMRLRVKDERGLKLSFDQVVLRNLLRVVDILPALYLVGGLTCLLSERNQRLGDIAAGTVVVFEPKTSIPDIQKILGDKYNSFRRYPHLEARLRQSVSPDLTALALEALSRRDVLESSERVRLFRDFAAHFARLVPFPDEATLGITDEQYVRNVVDSLFTRRGDRDPEPGRHVESKS